MCGIAGFIGLSSGNLEQVAKGMSDALRHRGPDASGVWSDTQFRIALSHRRLAIVDLSEQGAQPMCSASGRFIVVYNGEIYNYRKIKLELEHHSHRFRGSSDTEVLLSAVEQWGIQDAVAKFNGMFAFALYDTQEKVLHLCRDRIGIKPLYFGWQKSSFMFASELKSFQQHPDFLFDIDRDALALFMRFSYVPAPYSIYRGIYKLEPGCILSLSLESLESESLHFSPSPDCPGKCSPQRYWSVEKVYQRGQAEPFLGDSREALLRLQELLRDSVSLRMIADVPLGAFLSGGVDSSLIVALMQEQASSPVKTFSIGFHEGAFNEALYAKEVARHLGTEHTEMYLSSQQALEVIPLLPKMYDEPFGDSSQIPTYLVSKLAREHVTVSLSGDGGDELFYGYTRYNRGLKLWNILKLLPPVLRSIAAGSISSVSSYNWDKIISFLKPVLPAAIRNEPLGHKIHKMAILLRSSSDFRSYYQAMISHWLEAELLVLNSQKLATAYDNSRVWIPDMNPLNCMSFMDLISYLPEDILTKVDRASMMVSLEARVPLLDYRVIEFANTLPDNFKQNGKSSKWLLRQLLYQYVPRELIERPKKGFSVPMSDWLRGPLRDWAEELLSPQKLKQQGFLNAELVLKKWQEHRDCKQNWHYYLWDILMFQAWLEEQKARVI